MNNSFQLNHFINSIFFRSQHYCWLEGSFSVVDSTGKAVTENVAYPGVKTLNEANGDRRQSHKYYQWVYFVLIIQVSAWLNCSRTATCYNFQVQAFRLNR